MSQVEEILGVLSTKGPMTVAEVKEALPTVRAKSVDARLYEMRREPAKIVRHEDGTYEAAAAPDDSGPPQAQSEPAREPLTGDRARFVELLKDCAVRQSVNTITDSVFLGDETDLDHVAQVLEDARAFVELGKARLILRHWARYLRKDVPEALETRLSGSPGRTAPDSGPELVDDLGMGWRVGKDRDGDFVPVSGGELSYREALKGAAQLAIARGQGDQPSQAGSDRLKLLEEELRAERQARLNERDARMEEKLEELRAALQINSTSPTVQLIKDSADKFDKNTNRLIGMAEKAMMSRLPKHELVPEHHSTEAEREERAERMTAHLAQTARSIQLSRELFGVRG